MSASVNAPPSKTLAHRELIAASLAGGESRIRGLCLSEDIAATVDCVRALGAEVELTPAEPSHGDPSGADPSDAEPSHGDPSVADPSRGDPSDADTSGAEPTNGTRRGYELWDARVIPNAAEPADILPCRESGSTLRFLLPLCLTRTDGKERLLTGSERLLARPLGVYEELCRERGLKFERTAEGVCVAGVLEPGEFTVRGDVSSQFITGLLFALPRLGGESVLRIKPPLVSRPYLDVTLDVLERFGARIGRRDDLTFLIEGNQTLSHADLAVEGDFSNAAYLDAFRLFGWKITVGNLPEQSAQGDRRYREFFAELAAGCPTLDITDTPDLAPVLMALGAALGGVRLTGTARLRMKESDRGEAMAEELAKFGVSAQLGEDMAFVPPAPLCKPVQPLSGHNDHRVVMALSLLCAEVGGEIEGAEAVNKSFPGFFDAVRSFGVEVNEHD